MSKSLADAVEDFSRALQPFVETYAKAVRNLAESINDALAPLFARAKPYETGRELAEVVVENRLTAAERHPVRAATEYDRETVAVQYDDGTGFETFVEYRKEAIADE